MQSSSLRRDHRLGWIIGALLFGLGIVPAASGNDPDRGAIEIEVEYPPAGAVVNGSACGVFVAGRARAFPPERLLDVVIVLDTSLSTIDASGADLNGNGIVGRRLSGRVGSSRSTDPGDSVLAAEVAAARLLLRGLDSRRTRLALLTFAGEGAVVRAGDIAAPQKSSAITVEPLTFDHAAIDLALSTVLLQEPSGNTHMAAGIDQAVRELATGTSLSREKVVVFFTDGQPTLPYGPAFERENVLSVLTAADRAAREGVHIHAFALGSDALAGPVAAVEMAARTGGSFTPVPRPSDLPLLMRDVRFAHVSDVSLRNTTTGALAQLFRFAADGSWIGFLKMEPGQNRIEVSARSGSGGEATSSLEVHLDPDVPEPALPPMFVVQRNELLEICLDGQRRLRVSLEERRLELILGDLRLEIENARAQARGRAAAQRKQLKLSIEEERPAEDLSPRTAD